MKGILFICIRHRKFGIFNFYALSATSYCFARYIILEKDDISWNISSWCMPQFERFLFIWQVFYTFVQDIESSVSSTSFLYLQLSYALYGKFCRKRWIFYGIFQVGACPNLKDSLIYIYSYVQDIESSVPSTFLRYLRLPKALQGTLFWKKMILYEIFQERRWCSG